MTEESMETEDPCQSDSSDLQPNLNATEKLVPEKFRSVPENVIVVPNVFDPKPMSIHQLAYQKDFELVAVARFSRSIRPDHEGNKSSIKGPVGKIEVWGTCPKYRMRQSFYLPGEFSSVEGLCWYKDRLFSCGTHGHLVEYDLHNENIKKWTSVPGGTKWCMAIHEATGRIVVGSEDGFVVILQIYEHDVEVEKRLDRQEDRVLCVAWSPDGSRLVTGSPNAVRIWDVKSGQAVDRISIGRSKANEDTIVWCTDFLDDTTFATGDSKGRICIWDANMGVCSETHQTKLQQVQCLAVRKGKIYCGGVGKQIQVLLKTSGEYSKGWELAATRTIHSHDVRALAAVTDDELLSGGVDSYLIASNAPPISLNVIPPYCSWEVAMAPFPRLIMVRCIDYAAISHLPEGTHLSSALFRFNTSSPIISIGISDDGRWCALSTVQTAKLFALDCFPGNGKATAESVMLPSKNYKAFRRIQFSSEPVNMAAIVRKDNSICVVMLSYEMKSSSELHVIELNSVLPGDSSISLMRFAENTLIVSDFSGNVSVFNGLAKIAKKLDWKLLPKHKTEVTAIAPNLVNPDSVILFYADGQISEFKISEVSYKILLERELLSEESARRVRGSSLATISCHNSKEDFFLSVDSGRLIGYNRLNMLRHKEGKGQSKYPPRMEVNLGKFLVNVGQMQNGDICVVNASHEKVLEKLPPLPVSKSFKKYL